MSLHSRELATELISILTFTFLYKLKRKYLEVTERYKGIITVKAECVHVVF